MTTPSQPSTVHLDDVDLAYVETGQGDPIILVHGSFNDYRSWGGQLGPFSERYHVVAYSRRYHWPNAQPGDGATYAVAQHAADLGGLIEALGLPPVHLVGSSYGAMTSLTLALARPELVRSLVLGEPPILPWLSRTPDGRELMETFMRSAFEPCGQAFARGDAAAGVRLFIDGVIGPGTFERVPPPTRAMWLDNAASLGVETVTPPEQYYASGTPEDVARLHLPLLLLEGERSPAMFGRVTDELARARPDAERLTIPAASHGMHGQNPSAYNAVVLDFLGKH
jgi:pimeloyl-ACP methyl ester carboxylesterase